MVSNAFIRIKINSAEKFRYLHFTLLYESNRKKQVYISMIKFMRILSLFSSTKITRSCAPQKEV